MENIGKINSAPSSDPSSDNDANLEKAKHDALKAKYTGTGFNGGWAKMTHWYKEHPDEIGDLIFDGAEHDAEWYQQNPSKVGDLVRDYLAFQANSRANQVALGEIDLDFDKIKQRFLEDNTKALETAEKELDGLRPDLAELYAKSRGLFFGGKKGKYLAKFDEVKRGYKEKLNNFLHLKSEKMSDAEFDQELGEFLAARVAEARAAIEAELTEFAGGDLEHTAKTQDEIDAEKTRLIDEADAAIRAEIYSQSKANQTKKNVDFLEDYLDQATKLEKATTDAIDGEGVKGAKGVYRRFVHKVVNNKVLKGTLAVATVAGLAVTGVGLAAGVASGTLAIGASYTIGGVAAGAAKGAAGGLIGSRQDSRVSKVRGFVSEDQIKEQLEGIDQSGQNADVANVTDWLLGQYRDANRSDHTRNKVRTGVAMGIGTLMGGLLSGVRIDKVNHTTETRQQFKGYKLEQQTESYRQVAQSDIDAVDIKEGKGLYEVFRQMGGNEQNQSKALEIAQSVYDNYNVSFDPNGVQSSGLADIYPGKIESWPAEARSIINSIINKWGQEGIINTEELTRVVSSKLIPQHALVEKTITHYAADGVKNFLTQKVAPAVGGVIAGGAANSFQSRVNKSLNGETRARKRSRGAVSLKAANPNLSTETVPDTDKLSDEILDRTIDNYTAEVANDLVDIFGSFNLDDQFQIMQGLLGMPTAPSSPAVKEFVDHYHSLSSDIQDRVIDGIQDAYNNQDFFKKPSYNPATGQTEPTTAPNPNPQGAFGNVA